MNTDLRLQQTRRVRKFFIYLILSFFAIVWLVPIISTITIAFKSPTEFINTRFYAFPERLYILENLRQAFRAYRLHVYFFNSLIYSVSGVAICILVSAMAGFSIAKLRPRFNFTLFMIIFSGTICPCQMYLIPLYNFYNKVGLYNTKLGMILFYAAICTPFALFVYRGYYLTLGDAVMEAARIDGCGQVRMFFQIYLPQLKAPTAVVAVFQGMWIWNDMLFGMVLSQTERVRPIMVAITSMAGTGGGNIPLLMTGVIFTSLPTILLFITLRKYFIQGYTFGNITVE
jgi:ABC-type glycerol-3-phosphate transport system permease component